MSRIERSDNRTYQEFLQQVTALVRQSRVPFKAPEFLKQAVLFQKFRIGSVIGVGVCGGGSE
jgi:hypothetical protein